MTDATDEEPDAAVPDGAGTGPDAAWSDFEGDVPELPDSSLRAGHAPVDEDALPGMAVGIPLPSAPPPPSPPPAGSGSAG
ncbi:hypothetical protein [Streptomyces adustus]